MDHLSVQESSPGLPVADDRLMTRRGVQRHLKNFFRPCLLLILRSWPTHGYDLAEKLSIFGFSNDRSRVYVELRTLGRDGLVRCGPQTEPWDRRIYSVTTKGDLWLHEWAGSLAATQRVLSLFMHHYRDSMEATALPVRKPLEVTAGAAAQRS